MAPTSGERPLAGRSYPDRSRHATFVFGHSLAAVASALLAPRSGRRTPARRRRRVDLAVAVAARECRLLLRQPRNRRWHRRAPDLTGRPPQTGGQRCQAKPEARLAAPLDESRFLRWPAAQSRTGRRTGHRSRPPFVDEWTSSSRSVPTLVRYWDGRWLSGNLAVAFRSCRIWWAMRRWGRRRRPRFRPGRQRGGGGGA
jgi:hypothetical protein